MSYVWFRQSILAQISIPDIQLETPTPSIQGIRIHVDTGMGSQLIARQIRIVTRVDQVSGDWTLHRLKFKESPRQIVSFIFGHV